MKKKKKKKNLILAKKKKKKKNPDPCKKDIFFIDDIWHLLYSSGNIYELHYYI